MMGLPDIPNPPMAPQIGIGKFGGFLQVMIEDEDRSRTSQLSVPSVMYPPQMSTLEKP